MATGELPLHCVVESARLRHWKRAFVKRIYPYALLLCDAFVLSGLYHASVFLNADANAFRGVSWNILGVILGASILGIYLVGGYNYRTNKLSVRFVSEHLVVSALLALVAFSVIFSVVAYGSTINTPRGVIGAVLVSFPLISIAYRLLLAGAQRHFQAGNALCLIGSDERTADLWKRLHSAHWPMRIFAIDPHGERVGERLSMGDPESPRLRSLGSFDLQSSIDQHYVEAYVVADSLDDLPDEVGNSLTAAKLHGHEVHTYESFFSKELKMTPPSELSLQWFLGQGFRLNRSLTYDRAKRLMDILLSSVGLAISAPLMLLVAIAVKTTSEGPVIFRQKRAGQNGRPFWIYKFRTMVVGSEKGDRYTRESDSRITPLGRFLRKSRLDELPQLWNVLKGDMSIIGPRAEWIELSESYAQKLPFYEFRHIVKPGITGWAQVNYRYGASTEDALEKLYYDFYYVRHYSFMLDLTIIVKTIYTMVGGRGR